MTEQQKLTRILAYAFLLAAKALFLWILIVDGIGITPKSWLTIFGCFVCMVVIGCIAKHIEDKDGKC